MKRKSAPSMLWKEVQTKIPRLEGDDGLKGVNHLERFSVKKLEEIERQSEMDKENEAQNKSEEEEKENVDKNYLLKTAKSKEVCFAVTFKTTKNAPKKDADGNGKLSCIIIIYSN